MPTRNIEKMKENLFDITNMVHGDLAASLGLEDGHAVSREYGIPFPFVQIIDIVASNLPEQKAACFFAEISLNIGHDGKRLFPLIWLFMAETIESLSFKKIFTTKTIANDLRNFAEGKRDFYEPPYLLSLSGTHQSAICAMIAANLHRIQDRNLSMINTSDSAIRHHESHSKSGADEARRQAEHLNDLFLNARKICKKLRIAKNGRK